MPQNFTPKLEPDIERLRERLREKTLAQGPEIPESKRELVREEIREFIEEVQEAIVPGEPQPIREHETNIQAMEPSQRVGALLSMVFEQGLEQTMAAIKNLDDPAVIDEFHDILVDSFFDLLVQRGIIKLV